MHHPTQVSTEVLAAAEIYAVARSRGTDRFVLQRWGTDTPVTDVTDQVNAGLAAEPATLQLAEDPDGHEYAALTDHGRQELGRRQAPVSKQDRYPATVWSRYRENVIPDVLFALLAVLLAGVLFDVRWLVLASTVSAGVVMASIVPVLVLEHRADMAYDRAHPGAGKVPSA